MKKNIENYENYLITDIGSVISKNYNKNRILKPRVNNKGYLHVNLSKKGKYKTFFIHRLVAEHFIDKIDNKNIVNHKNGIKTDNRVENLEWCTPSENTKHAIKIGLFSTKHLNTKGEKNGNSKINKEQAIKIKKLLREGLKIAEISIKLNISKDIIRNIYRKKAWLDI